MNFQELKEINYGKPSIELIDKFIRQEQAIIFFYKQQFKKDKRNYSFISENIGLKPDEIEELKKEYNLT
jgi:hypothetical protein